MASKKRIKKNESRMQGTRLSYNVSEQADYVRNIKKLMMKVINETERSVLKLFDSDFAEQYFSSAQDESISSQARILTNKITDKFSLLFNFKSKLIAKLMVKRQVQASSISLSRSLQKFGNDLTLDVKKISPTLKEIIKASVVENVNLIKSIKDEYLSDVKGQVMRSITTNSGTTNLIPALQKYKGISLRRAKNIALDQTRKVYNNVNAERMKNAGINQFIWLHSGGGQKPREDHIEMDGNKYSFDDPPIIDKKTGLRGIPGQAINCGCTMKPVYDFGEEEEYNAA
jgi:SPP1 gp7 family putative phage head morphogenesis protein